MKRLIVGVLLLWGMGPEPMLAQQDSTKYRKHAISFDFIRYTLPGWEGALNADLQYEYYFRNVDPLKCNLLFLDLSYYKDTELRTLEGYSAQIGFRAAVQMKKPYVRIIPVIG